MAYAFNDDKSKTNITNTTISHAETQTINGGSYVDIDVPLSMNIDSVIGLRSWAFMATNPIRQVAGLVLESVMFYNSAYYRIRVRNVTNSAITVNLINLNVTYMS